jgi:hypothetical protein
MAGTRTAGTVDGTANKFTATLHLIDASGDASAVSIVSATALSNVDIEALAAAYQACTQASIWKISVSSEYAGAKETNNAESNARSSVKDGINMLFRASDGFSAETIRVVAPDPSTMSGDDDIPLPGASPLTGLTTAGNTITGGTFESAQYTERRERRNNPRRGV